MPRLFGVAETFNKIENWENEKSSAETTQVEFSITFTERVFSLLQKQESSRTIASACVFLISI